MPVTERRPSPQKELLLEVMSSPSDKVCEQTRDEGVGMQVDSYCFQMSLPEALFSLGKCISPPTGPWGLPCS